MAYIKKKSERKYKITVCNGYKVNGQKRMKAQTITVPSSVPKRGIQQYVMAEAERIEKKFKYGVEESDQTHFEQYAENWLKRQEPFFKATTLSGGYSKRLCRRAKQAGYFIRLYYVGLDTAEESLRRIKNRVERGGHDIPAKDVQARFAHRFADVAKILPYCDEAKFFDNDNGFALVAEYRNGQLLQVGNKCPAWLHQMMQEIQ